MGIFYGNEPPAHVGGKQPYEGRKLAAALLVVVAAATPVDNPPGVGSPRIIERAGNTPSQRAARIAPLIPAAAAAAVDNPPGVGSPRIVERAGNTPSQRPARIASLLAVAAAQTAPPQQTEVLVAWIPADIAPQLQRKLPVSVTAVRVDSPIGRRPDAFFPPEDAQLQQRRQIAPLVSVVADQPTTPRWLRNVLEAWSPTDPPAQTRSKYPQPAVVVAAGQPRPPQFNYAAWQTADDPQQERKLPPSILAVRVDDPPVSSRELDLTPWKAADPLPQTAPKYVPAVVVADKVPFERVQVTWPAEEVYQQRRNLTISSVDNPVGLPDWFHTVYRSWDAPDPLPQAAPKYVPAAVVVADKTPFERVHVTWPAEEVYQQPRRLTINGVQVDNPVGLPDWFHTVYRAWDVPDPLPQVSSKYVPAVIADRASVKGLPLEGTPWVPPDPPLQEQRQLAPSLLAVQVDNPPPLNPLWWIDTVLGTWEPPPPLPTLNVKSTPPDGPPPVVVVPPGEPGAAGGFGPTRAQWRRLCKEWEEVECLADKLDEKAQEVTGKRRTVLEAAAQAAHEAAAEACTEDDLRLKEAARLAELLRGALRAVSLSQTVTTANAAKNYAHKVTEDEEDDEMTVILRFF